MKQIQYLALLTYLTPMAALGQGVEPSGAYSSYGVDQRLLLRSVEDDDGDRDTSLEAITGLSYSVVTETRRQRMIFDFGTDLYLSDGSIIAGSNDVIVSYEQFSADADLNLSVQSNRSDIAFLRDIANFINDEGVLILPGDFDDLVGGGWRYRTEFNGSLVWGETAPIGYSVSLAHTILTYQDASDELSASEDTSVGAGIRFSFDQVTTGTLDLGYDVFDEEGSDTERTWGLTGRLEYERPLGFLAFQIDLNRDEDNDLFWGGSVTRSYDLPTGVILAGLGAAEDEDGDFYPSGQLSLALELPNASIDLGTTFGIEPGDDRISASLQAAYTRELTPLSGMRVSFDFAQTSEPDWSDPAGVRSAAIAYRHQLTRDWSVNAGLRADRRETAGVAQDSATLFIGLLR